MKRLILLSVLIGFWSCEQDRLQDKETERFGKRRIFMALTPGQGDTDLSPALRKALAMGFDGPGDLNLDWGALEPASGAYTDPDEIIAWNQNNLQGRPLHLTLAPIQTTYTSVPTQLRGLAWNDSAMVNAYAQALIYLKSQLPGVEIQSVSVGNEVDLVLGDYQEQWDAYADFFNQVYAVAKDLWPEADIGVKMTYQAVLAGQTGVSASILSASDAILTTYYPEVTDFESNRELIVEDFAAVVRAFPGKEVHLLEVGFPSDRTISSSEDLQKDFVDRVFSSWDRHQDIIKSVTFVWLYDLSPETLEALAASYGSRDPEFISFLGSLGYLRYDKKEKKAYELLLRNIQERR